MGKRDPRIDAYIAKAPDFAKPILKEIRETVHAACPECEETLKWSSPSFLYKGTLCGMSAFKAHAMLGFWKGPLVVPEGERNHEFRNFGHLKSAADLPSKEVLTGYVKKAMALNDEGVTLKRAPRKAAKPIATGASTSNGSLEQSRKRRASVG